MSESPVPQTFSSLVDHVASLSVRMDAFEETQQRRTDDLRDAAAAAGEALERTKGLQVPEILRRLNGVERRINSMDGGRVANSITDQAVLATLTGAVNELTTVMRELVRQNTPTEAAPVHPAPIVCPATLVTGRDELQRMFPCLRPAGHPGMHRDEGNDTWTVTGV